MTAQHTPGPWTLHEIHLGTARHYSVHATWKEGTLKGVEFHGVAHIPADTGDAELEANARLIAAAPDLLAHAIETIEGIREAVRVMDLMGRGGDARELGRVGHNLSTAVAKATGAEPYAETDTCTNFLSDGRGCCRTCGHFHGPEDRS